MYNSMPTYIYIYTYVLRLVRVCINLKFGRNDYVAVGLLQMK